MWPRSSFEALSAAATTRSHAPWRTAVPSAWGHTIAIQGGCHQSRSPARRDPVVWSGATDIGTDVARRNLSLDDKVLVVDMSDHRLAKAADLGFVTLHSGRTTPHTTGRRTTGLRVANRCALIAPCSGATNPVQTGIYMTVANR